MSVKRKLISNAFYLFLDWLVLTGFSFLFWVIVFKTLLPEDYGIISTSLNLSNLLASVSIMGFGTTLLKLVSEYEESKRGEKKIALISLATRYVLIFGLVIMLSLIFLSNFLSPMIKLSQLVIWIGAVTMFLITLSQLFRSVLHGFQNIRKIFVSDVYGQVVKVVLTIFLIYLGLQFFGPLIALALSAFVVTLLRFNPRWYKSSSQKIAHKWILFEYAFPTFLIALSRISLNNVPYIILTTLKGTGVTGIFTVAMTIANIINVFPSIFSLALFPIISQLSVNKNSEKKQMSLINLVFRYSLFLSLPLALILIFFSEPIILLFSRPESLPASTLLPVLVLAFMINACGNVFFTSLYAIGKPKIQRNIAIVTTLVFFLFAIPLTYLFSAFGISFAYAASVAILSFLSFFYIKKFLRLTLKLKSVVKIVSSTIISFSFLYVVSRFTQNLILAILFSGMTCIIYAIILVPMKFYTADDIKILKLISQKFPIFQKQLSSLIKFLSKFSNHA